MKKKLSFSIIISLVAALIIIIGVLRVLNPEAAEDRIAIGYSSDTVRAMVVDIVEEGEIQMGEILQPYQVAAIRILEGEFEGEIVQIDHGKRQIRPEGFELAQGDTILVTIGQDQFGALMAYFVDYIRLKPLLLLILIFVVVNILVNGFKGVRSLLGIGVSVVVIIYYIVPNILAGKDPILVSMLGSFIFLAITQYLVYGWTLKTQVAMTGILFAMLVTGILAVVFVDHTLLSGFGDENSMFLVQQGGNLNIKNLLVGSIIIGTLGVLDDLVIGQISSVIEIYQANPHLSFRQRFRGAMNIGSDHVAATVNTLVLAYLGASLSMFLLFSMNNVDFLKLLNINYIAEEIVRSLVGTLGLFTSVPITTLIACWVVNDKPRLEKLKRIFGPLTNEYGQ